MSFETLFRYKGTFRYRNYFRILLVNSTYMHHKIVICRNTQKKFNIYNEDFYIVTFYRYY